MSADSSTLSFTVGRVKVDFFKGRHAVLMPIFRSTLKTLSTRKYYDFKVNIVHRAVCRQTSRL